MSGEIFEILAGDEFAHAVDILGINAYLVYFGSDYEVWWIADYELDKLIAIPDDDWKPEWGWWRYADGCNITDWPTKRFIVNGASMLGWYRESDESPDVSKKANRYDCLTSYMCNEIGASTEKKRMCCFGWTCQIERNYNGRFIQEVSRVTQRERTQNESNNY